MLRYFLLASAISLSAFTAAQAAVAQGEPQVISSDSTIIHAQVADEGSGNSGSGNKGSDGSNSGSGSANSGDNENSSGHDNEDDDGVDDNDDDNDESGSGRDEPRVPGGSGCDHPGDVAEHAECRT